MFKRIRKFYFYPSYYFRERDSKCPPTARGLVNIDRVEFDLDHHLKEILKLRSERKKAKMDNWIHRSSRMKCETCMWFIEKHGPGKLLSDPAGVAREEIGRCRRHAPTMNGFPVVFKTDWCGDHKLDENKI